MAASKARLDAYAHNPYPLRPLETPSTGGCDHCETITMATLERLQREVRRRFGSRMRIWLTEYGYQTNPPDRILGVSKALQARYVSEAAQRSFAARNVDMLIHYLYQDEPDVSRWQSGLRRRRRRRQALVSGRAAPRSRRSRASASARRSGARSAPEAAGSATCCSSSGAVLALGRRRP